jgi:hypothetical protein
LPLAALKTSLALWRRRYNARLKLRAVARQDLLEARDADLHPRRALVDRQILREQQTEEALQMVKRRERQIAARKKGKVREPFCRVKMNVACQSSRNGAEIKLIVLHATQGANVAGITDLQGLGAFFDRISTQASSTVGNDAEGNNARFVPDSGKAWAQAAYNPQSLSIEQIGFAEQTSWPAPQLRSTAQWIAYWSHGPLARGVPRAPGVAGVEGLGDRMKSEPVLLLVLVAVLTQLGGALVLLSADHTTAGALVAGGTFLTGMGGVLARSLVTPLSKEK